jgi:hypothetical protein
MRDKAKLRRLYFKSLGVSCQVDLTALWPYCFTVLKTEYLEITVDPIIGLGFTVIEGSVMVRVGVLGINLDKVPDVG